MRGLRLGAPVTMPIFEIDISLSHTITLAAPTRQHAEAAARRICGDDLAEWNLDVDARVEREVPVHGDCAVALDARGEFVAPEDVEEEVSRG